MSYLDGYSFLGSGNNNKCYYKDNVVVKVFTEYSLSGNRNYASNATKETKQMMAANSINDLAVKFISLESPDSIQYVEYLFMEKIESLSHEEICSLSVNTREFFVETFKSQLMELHAEAIYHIDIKTPSGCFDNVLITSTGIRLIDWGKSSELESYGKKLVNKKEWDNFCDFEYYFMNLN
jgi:hypothetical protein